jgi:hypothetical protein
MASRLKVVLMTSGGIGLEVAARLAGLDEVGQLAVVTTNVTNRRRRKLEKARIIFRHEGPRGLARALGDRWHRRVSPERLAERFRARCPGATLFHAVAGAPDLTTARAVAKSVVMSSLVKAAMFGADANWGRILCAIGYAEAEFDVSKIEVHLSSPGGRIQVCQNGVGVPFSEETAKEILLEKEIRADIDMHQGGASATAWGCDLTYDYVKINGDYRT